MSDFQLINVILLFMVTLVALAVVVVRNLLAAGMLMSIYSFLMALIWTNMDSMDVAFTEAAVGAGISTVLFIGALVHVGTEEKPLRPIHWPALVVTAATAIALLYGTAGMPRFGDGTSPANSSNVAAAYIEQNVEKSPDPARHHTEAAGEQHEGDYFHGHVPNFVTSVIVSYRGYDTMYETTVIFIAGLSMILFLRLRKSGE
jgi:multicomponent Na+:H+ antiporter subunit B